MNSFNFEITLNYAMDTFSIKPPLSYTSLVDVTKEKFDLAIVNRMVYYDDEDEVNLTNDTDYLNMFDFVELKRLTEIDIIVKSDDQKIRRKKSLRKRSSINRPPVLNTIGLKSEEGCVNGI
jgi:hypothetical protein